MKIVIDKNIPFIQAPLENLGETIYLKGDAITPEVMHDADILLTRTRTKCDKALLDGSRCSFIGTATIGTDHIDLAYCHDNGITVANAPGCNAPGVAQYVMAAIKAVMTTTRPFSDLTIGIIGAGNVGSLVKQWGESLGMRVLVNDPPKYGSSPLNTPLDVIANQCDVITVHTPLTRDGEHPTYHLINQEFLSKVTRRPLLINSARGGVIDTVAVKQALDNGTLSAVAIDCWEGEPEIDSELLDLAVIATPHIAGYSYEGKVRATKMVLDALTAHLSGKGIAPAPLDIPLNPVPSGITPEMIGYDIIADSRSLKEASHTPALADTFESLRNNYLFRHEPGQ
jgi:erythronate-4-phosphate dehydrogenase